MSRLTQSLSTLALSATALVAARDAADAQCFLPDNLTGPCWEFTQANLPDLDLIALQGSGFCWDSCALAGQDPIRILVDKPVQTTSCGQYTATVRVVDGTTGAILLIGDSVLDYTRTWREFGVAGGSADVSYQVWRFCFKADLGLTQPGAFTTTCPVPQSLSVLPSAFFYGYVDYAMSCIDGTMSNSLVLFHNSDFFQHNSLSAFPGVYEPTTTYAIVGPDTPANPFSPANGILPPGGPLVGEATRSVTLPSGGPACMYEEPIVGGLLLPFFQLCFGPLSLGSTFQTLSLFEGETACADPATGLPSSFEALQFFPTLPWPWLVSTDIGHWTTDAAYPGEEAVWVNEGFFRYTDSCISATGTTLNPTSVDVMYGATTDRGYDVGPVDPLQPGLLTQRMIDMASNWTYRLGSGGASLPLVGFLGKTDHLIYANVP